MSVEQVTIKDIARRLNVSPSTVSRALRDNPEIGEATKIAVRKLANEMNYQPNTLAMGLRQKKTFTIGVIVPEIVHYFFSSVISGIEDIAYDNNFQIILCQSNEKYNQEMMNIKTLSRSQVDGILISFSKETRDFNHLTNLGEKGIPVVCYDRASEVLGVDSVVVDDFGGAYLATRHLMGEGCKRIAHFMGPLHLKIHSERCNGYQKAQSDFGLKVREELMVEADSFKGAYRTVYKLIEQGIDFDGIFAVNDLTAVGAMKALKSKGIKIPHEVAVVGFGDDTTLSEMVDPTLSSVSQPGFEMGKRATKLLIDKINGLENDTPQTICLDTHLRVRQSSDRSSLS
jgi:DNA-binding LacI/PurR family transcriptional regulator